MSFLPRGIARGDAALGEQSSRARGGNRPARSAQFLPAGSKRQQAASLVLAFSLRGPKAASERLLRAGQVVRLVGDAAAAWQVAGRALPQAGLYVDKREWSHAGLNRGPYGYWPYALTS